MLGNGHSVAADVVVLACGPAVQRLAGQAGVAVPMLHKPARVALTTALSAGLLSSMLCTRDVFVMQVGRQQYLLICYAW